MANQGPEAPEPSPDHGVGDAFLGDVMSQAITATLRRLLTRPAILTQLGDQFLESDHLVQGIADVAAHKKDSVLRAARWASEAHLRDVRAIARLVN